MQDGQIYLVASNKHHRFVRRYAKRKSKTNVKDHNNNCESKEKEASVVRTEIEPSRNSNNNNKNNKHRDHDTTSSQMCKFYNPYFGAGCHRGRHCKYMHMKEHEFLAFCQAANVDKNICSSAIRKFESVRDMMEHRDFMCHEKKQKQALNIFQTLLRDYEYNDTFNFWFARFYDVLLFGTEQSRKTKTRFSDTDMFNGAQFYYRRCIAIDPRNAHYHALYAVFSMQWAQKQKKPLRCSLYKQAKEHFSKSLSLHSSAKIHFHFARFLDEVEGDLLNARYHYECALDEFFYDNRIRLNYARLLHKLGQLMASKQEFVSIINALKSRNRNYCQLHTRFMWVHFHFARLLMTMQHYDQAYEQLLLCCEIMHAKNHRFYSKVYYQVSKLLFKHFDATYLQNAEYYIKMALAIDSMAAYHALLQQIRQAMCRDAAAAGGDAGGADAMEGPATVDDCGDEKEKETPMATPAETPVESQSAVGDGDDGTISDGICYFDDEDDDEDDDDEDNDFLADRFCGTEFDRYISSDVGFGTEFAKYCDRFDEKQCNDIRWLLTDQASDETFLRNLIGMNEDAVCLWLKSIAVFRQEHDRYVAWMKKHSFYEKYFEKFKVYGILHLQSFSFHMKNEHDVMYVTGEKNKSDARLIWKQLKQEMEQITQDFS